MYDRQLTKDYITLSRLDRVGIWLLERIVEPITFRLIDTYVILRDMIEARFALLSKKRNIVGIYLARAHLVGVNFSGKDLSLARLWGQILRGQTSRGQTSRERTLQGRTSQERSSLG